LVTFESRKDDKPLDNSFVDHGIAIPRAVESLHLNHPLIVAARAIWVRAGYYPTGHNKGWNSYCHARPT